MGAQMYQKGWYSTSGVGRSDQARIRPAGCSSHCARTRINSRARLYPRPTGPQAHFGESAVNVYVFTGPTISSADATRVLEAMYLPPAVEGDLYRVALKRPQAIGIIDGYFQSTPTVRHKEVLWAMSRGIHVFGSASMGALRAAELLPFGMEGVGAVFELYRDGILEDDDEVAVAHGPAEKDFVSASETMANIRQTLRKAERHGIISTELRVTLEKIGKALFYPDRNYSTLLRNASENGSSQSELTKLQQWLPNHRVNQKREDALLMLRVIHRRL